jgi:cell division protein FtsB
VSKLRKSKKPARHRSVLLRLALLCFCIYSIVQLTQLQVELARIKSEYSRQQQTNEKEERVVEALRSLLQNGDESDFIERAARDKLDYVYADEEVFSGQ